KINSLPPWIGELSELRILDVGGNRLIELPAEIGQLRRLYGLWALDNQLEVLPDDIKKLPLTTLGLEGNPKLGIPESILAKNGNPNQILRYYFESYGGKGHPLLELKLLLVGRGKAGKTTLVKRLSGEEPLQNESGNAFYSDT